MNVSFRANFLDQAIGNTATGTTPQPQIVPALPAAEPDSFTSNNPKPKKSKKVMDYVSKYGGAAAIAALPLTIIGMKRVNAKAMKQMMEQVTAQNKALERQLTESLSSLGDKNVVIKEVQKQGSDLWKAMAAIFGGMNFFNAINKSDNTHSSPETQTAIIADGKQLIQDIRQDSTSAKQTSIEARDTSQQALTEANNAKKSKGKGPLNSKYLENVHGFELLKGVDKKAGFSQSKYEAAITTIQNSAATYLDGSAQKGKAPLKPGDTVWSVTSEFAPIKEGGLGSVPVEIQSNFEKLGVKTPTFIPMYQKNGFATLSQKDGKYSYNYSGTLFNLDKVAEYRVHSYKSPASKDEPVEVFVSTSKVVNGKTVETPPLVFIKNDEYFNGTIYSSTAKSEEPEKFAFFSKAVYEFAKAKLDPDSVKGMIITNPEKYDSIAAPDGLMLNDWQASPIAALSRYKAPMENAYGVLNDLVTKRLSDIRIITVGHNAQYQGSTLMDNDYDQRIEVSENILNTLFDNFASDIVRNAESKAPYDDLKNVLVMNKDNGDRNVNFLNMGICLSDYFAPVSQNYAKELVNDNSKSGALQWAIETKSKNGTVSGIINGNDLTNIGLEHIKDSKIKKATNVDFSTYNAQSSKEDVMQARLHNKKAFLNDFIKPFTSGTIDKSLVGRLENIGSTTIPEISDDELAQTPVFSFVHRLVDQKGVDIVADAIKQIYNNWDTNFPGKSKPIFYLGGEDGEGGHKRALIEQLKKDLKPEDSNRVVFAHGFAPIHGFMAASDYFLMPSKFEPCGLTQSESFAQGTPVIATATGGIVDTIIASGDKQTGILTSDISGTGFYKAINEGLDVFFNQREKYENMVMNAIKSDFSWIQPDRQGPIYEYLEKLGISKNLLPEKSEIK